MARIVPESWMPDCRMQRVITHWTAGAHHASTVDREHYHLLVEADGRLVRGDYSIADNVRTSDGEYAAHTARCNTGSIGIAVCCMAGAIQRPFRAGRFPMTRAQYEAMALATADLCDRYRIAVTPRTVLGHGEVEANLGIPQRGKWDPMLLPWAPETPLRAVGEGFRRAVEAKQRDPTPDERLPPVTVVLDGRTVSDEGILKSDLCWAPLRPLADALGWTILRIDSRSTQVRTPSGEKEFRVVLRGDRGLVPVRDLCAGMGWPAPLWEASTRTIRIRSA
jgi:hypothetical protein